MTFLLSTPVDKVLFIRWWTVSSVAVYASFIPVGVHNKFVGEGQTLPAFIICSSIFVFDSSEQQQITRVGQKLSSCDQDIKIKNYPAIRPDNASYPVGYRTVSISIYQYQKATNRPDSFSGASGASFTPGLHTLQTMTSTTSNHSLNHKHSYMAITSTTQSHHVAKHFQTFLTQALHTRQVVAAVAAAAGTGVAWLTANLLPQSYQS